MNDEYWIEHGMLIENHLLHDVNQEQHLVQDRYLKQVHLFADDLAKEIGLDKMGLENDRRDLMAALAVYFEQQC